MEKVGQGKVRDGVPNLFGVLRKAWRKIRRKQMGYLTGK